MLRWFGFLALAAATVGCADPSVDPLGDPLATDGEEDAQPLRARVMIERVTDAGTVRTSAAAKFFHAADADLTDAERWIGALPVLPAEGECVALHAAPADVRADITIDLLDVGDVTMFTRRATLDAPARGESESGVRTMLSARAFPDVGEIASGIFYTSPDAELDLAAPAHYRIATDELAADPQVDLTIEGFAPSPPRMDRVRSFTPGADLTVAWSRPTHEEVAYLSEAYVDFIGERTFRCGFVDEGAAVLPSEVTREANDDGSATVVVHRVVRQTSRGTLGSGAPYDAVILFDLADATRVSGRALVD